MNNYILPNWPAPKNVKAFTTKRTAGNFSLRTGDDPAAVLMNRKKLYQELNLPAEPFWLQQEHTNIVIHLEPNTQKNEPVADASFATKPNLVCAVQTADCVPILVCDKAGTTVGAIHAGWKGIATGVIEATIKTINIDPKKLLVWLGPAIGANSFATKDDVREIFIKHDPNAKKAFVKHHNSFLTNIYLLATQRLNAVGVTEIYGGEYCTFSQKELFFSFRRDGEKSGRMASLIWINAS
jgi:polyphenol oxidase